MSHTKAIETDNDEDWYVWLMGIKLAGNNISSADLSEADDIVLSAIGDIEPIEF